MRAFLVAIQSPFAIAILFALGLDSLPAFAAESDAAGRKHAAKANQLAGKNKCKPAVVEFTKAYKSLKDPTILFNRAECQRKLGNNSDALTDYELFLTEMPAAPNRASVEARIASLREVVRAESAVTPVVPAAPAASAAAPAAIGGSPPAPEAPKHAEKAPEAPVHRAERWAD